LTGNVDSFSYREAFPRVSPRRRKALPAGRQGREQALLMTNEQFSNEDFKELEKETESAHEALKRSHEEMREKRGNEIADALVRANRFIDASREVLDAGEIPPRMTTEDALGFFEEKKKELIAEAADTLGSGERAEEISETDVDNLESIKQEQVETRKEISLAALRSILSEDLKENNFLAGITVAEYIKDVNKRLAELRKKKSQ
jgi:hypothetical protein